MNNVFKKVLMSEKSFRDAGDGKYTFVVDSRENKETIAKTCEILFGVTVLSVNSMNYNGKIKMTRRIKGKRSDFKKVILTLKSGDKIDLFETEEKEKKKEKAEKPVKKSTDKQKESNEATVTVKEKKK